MIFPGKVRPIGSCFQLAEGAFFKIADLADTAPADGHEISQQIGTPVSKADLSEDNIPFRFQGKVLQKVL